MSNEYLISKLKQIYFKYLMSLIALCEAMMCASLVRCAKEGSKSKSFASTERTVNAVGKSGRVVSLLELATRSLREGREARDGRWERLQPTTSSLTRPANASKGGRVRRFSQPL